MEDDGHVVFITLLQTYLLDIEQKYLYKKLPKLGSSVFSKYLVLQAKCSRVNDTLLFS